MPRSARRSLASVSAAWLGLPMILTCAVFGGLVVRSLGFWSGMAAIAVGNLILTLYVGFLSYLAGCSGKNFALMARRTFGSRGYVVPAAFLATIVTGWFAFQTGLTGETLKNSAGWSPMWTSLAAGAGYVAVTLLGIRALTWIGVIAAPLYLVLGITAVCFVTSRPGASKFATYPGDGAGTMGFAAAVTLVVALFADSGTMTADFTRWSRSGRAAVLASLSAFPLGNSVALVIGGLIVAMGGADDPASSGGDFLGILASHGGALVPLAIAFVLINLGSVCAHCLYNGAVAWSQLAGTRMRPTALLLGTVGALLAVAGVWSHFEEWLNLLGVIVPPIGTILIVDQLRSTLWITPRNVDASARSAAWRPAAFAAWAAGAAGALVAHDVADWLSTAVIGIAVAALVLLLSEARPPRRIPPTRPRALPHGSQGTST
ncbi:purine-cytosine permease family protein [Streptomyces sp. NPDC101151]|uniref:purine-cytosine permease family protein n=1 Tax=Streptomyces sp. NPDC101151 TaxID=3366115 RepID=UPI00381833A5